MLSGVTIVAVASDDDLAERLRAELGDIHIVQSVDAVVELAADHVLDVVVVPTGVPRSRIQALQPFLAIIVLAPDAESPEILAAVESGSITEVVEQRWRPRALSVACKRAAERAALQRNLRDHERRAKRRLDAACTLGDVAVKLKGATSYEQIAHAVAQSLGDVLDLGLCAVLIAHDSAAAVLHLHCREPNDESLLRATRDRCLELFRATAAGGLDEDELDLHVSGEPPTPSGWARRPRSTMHERLVIDGRTVGLLFAGAAHADGFSTDDRDLLAFLAGRVSDVVVRHAARELDEGPRLSLMVESMADGLIFNDLLTDELLINSAARTMLDIPETQHVDREFLKSGLGFYPFDLIATNVDSAGPLQEEVRVANKILHSMVSPVRDDTGKLVGVVVVLRDFTGRQDFARRQQEFVAVVSHELRTPLTSISGALDIALSEHYGKLSSKQRPYLTLARDSCTRLNAIIDDLLDVASAEGGRMKVQFMPLLLDELGAQVAERYRPAAQKRGIELRVKSEDSQIRIVGDSNRLTQVLNNLLSNAIKFTPEGGEVEVEIFGPSIAANHVGVSVFNNGEPIPVSARERIFDKFEQAAESEDRQVGGSGLGLAISRAIIEAHRGRIWVEGDSGGTKFVFTLPAAPEPNADPSDVEEIELGAVPNVGPGSTVLLVDDDQYSSYILKGILMAAGHEVSVAATADGALATARERRPALVLLNAQLTEDALALVPILKHDPDTSKAAVLVIARDRDPALAAGADDCLEKPIDPDLLRATCERLIAEAGRSRACRIMVVDDDPAIRAICRGVLQSAGYAVREAADGEAAIREARRFKPDLLLLDIMMPGIDGFKTAERFRSESATAMTPIIFLSAKGAVADKVRAFRIGAEDYIVKPFVAAEMVARVRKAVDRSDRALAASPTTRLPGANAIEKEIESRIADGGNHAFCYLDLDNLKAFNDYYGYAKADGVVRQTGDLVRDVVEREGGRSDFIGHIAGDDFVFITSVDAVDQICQSICAAFDRLAPLYYNRVDREQGYIETKDRYGMMRKFPLMGVSVAAVTSVAGAVKSYSQLAAAAAAGKTIAKTITGSAYVKDGEVIFG